MENYALTELDQKRIIDSVIHNPKEALRNIENKAGYLYDEDMNAYAKIINSNKLKDAIKLYWDMDTAAREEFMSIVMEIPEADIPEDTRRIIDKWYDDGFATWSCRGNAGKDGEDGLYGGSLHSHEMVHNMILIDFGSSDKEKALKELNKRLAEKHLKALSLYPNAIHDRLVVISNKEQKVCPICHEIYTAPSAISRKDNKTKICPGCGMIEAVQAYAKAQNNKSSKKVAEK